MGGSGSGRWGSRRPIAEGLQRFDLAEYMRDPDAVKPNASCIANIRNGKLSAQVRYTETATCFGGRRLWMLCPRCSQRCRVLFFGLGRVACRRCFRLRYHSQTMDRIRRAQHAMRKIAKQLDPEADLCLPDLPDRQEEDNDASFCFLGSLAVFVTCSRRTGDHHDVREPAMQLL